MSIAHLRPRFSALQPPRALRQLPDALRLNRWAHRPLIRVIPTGSPLIVLHRRGGVSPGEPPSSLTPQFSSARPPRAPSPSLAASPTGLTTGKLELAGPPLSSTIGQWLPCLLRGLPTQAKPAQAARPSRSQPKCTVASSI
jgi:hypothetical protein